MTPYEELLLELRHRYRRKYDKSLDDEIIVLIIRMNELQVDLKKDIAKNATSPPPRKPSEYFFFGLGKGLKVLLYIVTALLIGIFSVLIYK